MRDAQGAYASINFAVYDESHFKIEPEGIRLPDQVTELMRSSFPRARQHKESFYVPLRYHDKVRNGTTRRGLHSRGHHVCIERAFRVFVVRRFSASCSTAASTATRSRARS